MPWGPEVERFRRLAWQRLEDAHVLLRNGRRPASVYLAGYAVECILKALIIESHHRKEHHRIVTEFRGQTWHDVEFLRRTYVSRTGRHVPRDLARALTHVATWSTELRYQASDVPPARASQFIESAESIVSWGEGVVHG